MLVFSSSEWSLTSLCEDMVGKQVDAELYKLPDGQLRASHVRALRPVLENAADDEMPQLEGQDEDRSREGHQPRHPRLV